MMEDTRVLVNDVAQNVAVKSLGLFEVCFMCVQASVVAITVCYIATLALQLQRRASGDDPEPDPEPFFRRWHRPQGPRPPALPPPEDEPPPEGLPIDDSALPLEGAYELAEVANGPYLQALMRPRDERARWLPHPEMLSTEEWIRQDEALQSTEELIRQGRRLPGEDLVETIKLIAMVRTRVLLVRGRSSNTWRLPSVPVARLNTPFHSAIDGWRAVDIAGYLVEHCGVFINTKEDEYEKYRIGSCLFIVTRVIGEQEREVIAN